MALAPSAGMLPAGGPAFPWMLKRVQHDGQGQAIVLLMKAGVASCPSPMLRMDPLPMQGMGRNSKATLIDFGLLLAAVTLRPYR
jgi:hypothetical protein